MWLSNWHSGGGAWEIEAVSVHSDADTVYLGLGGSNGGNHSGVCDSVVMGNGDFATKKTVLVPVGMRVPKPWERRPKSFARTLTQVSPSGPQMRCRYLSA